MTWRNLVGTWRLIREWNYLWSNRKGSFRDVTWRGLVWTWRLIRDWSYLLAFRAIIHINESCHHYRLAKTHTFIEWCLYWIMRWLLGGQCPNWQVNHSQTEPVIKHKKRHLLLSRNTKRVKKRKGSMRRLHNWFHPPPSGPHPHCSPTLQKCC